MNVIRRHVRDHKAKNGTEPGPPNQANEEVMRTAKNLEILGVRPRCAKVGFHGSLVTNDSLFRF